MMRALLVLFAIVVSFTSYAQDTDFEDAYQEGLYLAEQKQYEKAIAKFNEFIAIENTYADAFYNRGYCKAQLKDYESAKLDFDTSLLLKIDRVQARFWRGVCLVELGDYDAALYDLNKAEELLGAPEKGIVAARARAYLGKGDYYNAIKNFDQAISYTPDVAELYFGRAKCNYYMKSLGKVMPDLEKYLAEDPASPEALEMAMRTSFELKDFQNAIAYAKRYSQLDVVGYMGDLFQGTIYFTLRQYDNALTAFNTAIEKNGSYAEAYYSRAVCYSVMNRMDDACKDFHKAINLGYTSIAADVKKVCP